MDLKVAEALVQANPELELREKYSGRFMYGDSTAAVVFSDEGDLIEAMLLVMEDIISYDLQGSHLEGIEKFGFIREMKRLRRDNMGLGMVAY